MAYVALAGQTSGSVSVAEAMSNLLLQVGTIVNSSEGDVRFGRY